MALLVYVRHKEYIECFYFTFTSLSTIGFGDYLPQFKNKADYSLVILAFVGLAFVSSIFCAMNNAYCLSSMGLVRALYGHCTCARRTQRSLRKKNQAITMNNYPVT